MAKPEQGFEMLFSYDNFIHAFAGATGSVVAMTAFYPFDTIRTRLQGFFYLNFKLLFIIVNFGTFFI